MDCLLRPRRRCCGQHSWAIDPCRTAVPGRVRSVHRQWENQCGGPISMRDFSGAVALVTGGGGGIGAAVVRLLTARGAKVYAVDIDEDAAGNSGADLAIGADVADRE